MNFQKLFMLLLSFTLVACAPLLFRPDSSSEKPADTTQAATVSSPPALPSITPSPTPENTPTALPTSTPTATPVPNPIPEVLGPDLQQFPSGYNPLTGLPASDAETLTLPALLVSLSHFPASVRPQTGLSFAAQVYEIYITEGMTRFLAVFYGNFPRNIPVLKNAPARTEPLQGNGPFLGNRIWWDENRDGIQQPYEAGLGGLQVDLLDAQGQLVATTFSDGNGYYAFTPPPGEYAIQLHLPAGVQVTASNRGAENLDSDADASGRIAPLRFESTDLDQDIGLLLDTQNVDLGLLQMNNPLSITNFENQADASLSGVRSAREAYVPIINAFSNSCLIAASKSKEVKVNICQNVYTKGNVNQAGISIAEMRKLAEANRNPLRPVNYSGNLFTLQPPEAGQPAGEIQVFYSWLNQARWKYDPVAAAYWRYHDFADPQRVGQFTPALDRLTGRPVLFTNVVVLFVEHIPRTSTIIDLNMGPGSAGKAIVFRNGMAYSNLNWTMVSEEYERQTGLTRPLRLRYPDGRPFPLAPGSTWFHVVTYGSSVAPISEGTWKLTFLAPAGTR
uniref:DUF3048 domain-containing protein n=1 Tax=uncultured Chloroflexota bacterium TaxID=166587 RepID=H5S9B8_9CHLR|nr:hypothetical protein HGMM_F03B08C32 [uncultured Chloroflexota bacterium]